MIKRAGPIWDTVKAVTGVLARRAKQDVAELAGEYGLDDPKRLSVALAKTLEPKVAPRAAAGVPSVTSYDDLLKSLTPGDTILTSRNPAGDILNKAYVSVAERTQGDLHHAAMYIGDGKVVDVTYGGVVRQRPLEEVVKRRDAYVVRAKAPPEEHSAALDRVRELEKQKVPYEHNVANILELAAGTRKSPRVSVPKVCHDPVTCGGVVTRAFPSVSFHPTKGLDAVTPRDLYESKAVEHKVHFYNPERPDAEGRMKLAFRRVIARRRLSGLY